MPILSTSRFKHQTLRLAAVTATAVLVCACTVGPDFAPPSITTPAGYTPDNGPQSAPATPIEYGSNPPADWWTDLHSPQLNAVIRQALTENHGLASTVARLAQARETVTASAGGRYPQITANADISRQKYGAEFRGPLYFPIFSAYALGSSVSYLLDYDGALTRSVEQQQALANAKAYELQAARLSLTGNVAMQALTIAGSRAQIEAVEDLLKQDRRNVSLVQTAMEAGFSTRVELLSAKSQLAQDLTRLPPLRRQLGKAIDALSILVGQAPANWQAPQFELNDFQPPAALPLSLPSELAHRRPDILAAEARLHAATAAIGVAIANLYPQIRLTADVSQQALDPGHLFTPGSTAWSLAAALTAPIFDGGTLHARKRAAVDAGKAALATYEQTVLESFGQVADVLQALQQDAAAQDAQRQALDTAHGSLLLTRQSYQAGNTDILRVLDAERQYQKARLGSLQARVQHLSDIMQLYLALGGSAPEQVHVAPNKHRHQM